MTDQTDLKRSVKPWTRRYWESAAAGELLYQECEKCGRATFPPRRFCPSCASEELSWRTSSGSGKIYSFTIVESGALEEFAEQMPYVTAIIELEEGFRMVSRILVDDEGMHALSCDQNVKVVFGTGLSAPCFRPS